MLPRIAKITFGIILVLTAALVGLNHLQQQRVIEVKVSPERVVWQKWGANAVDEEVIENLDFDLIASSPFDSIVTKIHRPEAERFRFTLADSADFRIFYRVLNHFATTQMTMRWRVESDHELLYRFPPFEDSSYGMGIPGGEDLALVKLTNQTGCVLVVTLTPSGIFLNDTLRTVEELKSDIATIIGQKSVTHRFILIVATPETKLSVGRGLFKMIADEGWNYQIYLNDPKD
jgi:hypothetical protein